MRPAWSAHTTTVKPAASNTALAAAIASGLVFGWRTSSISWRGRLGAVAIAREAQHVGAFLAGRLARVHAEALGAELDQDGGLAVVGDCSGVAEMQRRPRRRRRRRARNASPAGNERLSPVLVDRVAHASGSEHGVAVVAVEAAPALAAEPAGRHHAPEQRRRGRARIERDGIERLAQAHLGIEADQVEQLAAAPSCSRAPTLIAVSMSAGAGDARLDRADAVVVEGDQQRVEDEARLVLRLAPAAGRPPRTSAQAPSNVSSDVLMPGETSISFISCAGRQKCRPTTRSSRPEPPAISVIDKRRGVGGEDRVRRDRSRSACRAARA